MSEEQDTFKWNEARQFLTKKFPNCHQMDQSGSLTFDLDNEEWALEISANGTLAFQSGYDLDDMKSILSDGTAEDLGSDELAKQAKFYLQQTVSKYRSRLKQEGFTERTEMNDEYVAVMFEREINLDRLDELEQTIRRYQAFFSTAP